MDNSRYESPYWEDSGTIKINPSWNGRMGWVCVSDPELETWLNEVSGFLKDGIYANGALNQTTVEELCPGFEATDPNTWYVLLK